MRDLGNYQCEGQIDLVDYLEWLCEQEEKKIKGKDSKNEKRGSNV